MALLRYYCSTFHNEAGACLASPTRFSFVRKSPPRGIQRWRLAFMQIASYNVYASRNVGNSGTFARSTLAFISNIYFISTPRVIFVLLFSSRHADNIVLNSSSSPNGFLVRSSRDNTVSGKCTHAPLIIYRVLRMKSPPIYEYFNGGAIDVALKFVPRSRDAFTVVCRACRINISLN